MNTTIKKEDKGTQGVNASQTKSNGKHAPAEVQVVKPVEKLPIASPVLNGKPKTIEEQMKYFDGLAILVSIKRRFETHREAVVELTISEEELVKFETEKRYGVRISLHDESNNEYAINNAKLVKDVQTYLLNLLNARIEEYDQKIMLYGQN